MKMMRSLRKQQGMTGLGWLTIIALIIFFALVGMKMAPVYLENHSIQSTLETLKETPFITKKSIPEIRELMKRKFDINYIDSVNAKNKEEVIITKKGGVLEVQVKYEVWRNFAGNVFIVMQFDDSVKMVSN